MNFERHINVRMREDEYMALKKYRNKNRGVYVSMGQLVRSAVIYFLKKKAGYVIKNQEYKRGVKKK